MAILKSPFNAVVDDDAAVLFVDAVPFIRRQHGKYFCTVIQRRRFRHSCVYSDALLAVILLIDCIVFTDRLSIRAR